MSIKARKAFWDVALGNNNKLANLAKMAIQEAENESRREWQGLTDEEIKKFWSQTLADTEGETYLPLTEFARAIEAKLKEKNT